MTDKQVDQLVRLFDKRDRVSGMFTRRIAAMINDTVLTAIQEVFGVPSEHLVWKEMCIMDEFLVIRTLVTYEPGKASREFEQAVDIDGADAASQFPITIGIPLEMVFQDRERIKAFVLESMVGNKAPTIEPELPTPNLSDDQIKHMLWLSEQTRGVIQ